MSATLLALLLCHIQVSVHWKQNCVKHKHNRYTVQSRTSRSTRVASVQSLDAVQFTTACKLNQGVNQEFSMADNHVHVFGGFGGLQSR